MASFALYARRRVGDGRLMSASAATFELDCEAAARDREFSHRMLAAVVYSEQAYPDEILRQVVNRCRLWGVRLAGVMQHRPRDPGHRCDMLLEDLATKRQTSIFCEPGPRRKRMSVGRICHAERGLRDRVGAQERPGRGCRRHSWRPSSCRHHHSRANP
jgi:uncharacterized protein DUF2478